MLQIGKDCLGQTWEQSGTTRGQKMVPLRAKVKGRKHRGQTLLISQLHSSQFLQKERYPTQSLL